MNDPRKHHFTPSFYLDRWTAADGLVCEFSRPYGEKVRPQRRHPNATGFVHDLYKIEGVSGAEAQQFETEFFKPLDTLASRALSALLAGDSQALADHALRDGWARFLLSLMFRTPEAIHTLRDHMDDVWVASSGALDARYKEERSPRDPESLADYYEERDPGARGKLPMRLAKDMIDLESARFSIRHLTWRCIDLERSKFDLLASDRPIDRTGLGDTSAFIALPVGPKALFLATRTDDIAEMIVRADATTVVSQMNKTVVSQARRYVWGRDDRQLGFVGRYMSRVPDQVLITDAQRRQALEAAGGGTFNLLDED